MSDPQPVLALGQSRQVERYRSLAVAHRACDQRRPVGGLQLSRHVGCGVPERHGDETRPGLDVGRIKRKAEQVCVPDVVQRAASHAGQVAQPVQWVRVGIRAQHLRFQEAQSVGGLLIYEADRQPGDTGVVGQFERQVPVAVEHVRYEGEVRRLSHSVKRVLDGQGECVRIQIVRRGGRQHRRWQSGRRLPLLNAEREGHVRRKLPAFRQKFATEQQPVAQVGPNQQCPRIAGRDLFDAPIVLFLVHDDFQPVAD